MTMKVVRYILTGVILSGFMPIAWAQSENSSPSTGSAGNGSLENANEGIQDIVVTAERRSARLQDVPIAITAATAVQLQAAGVTDAFDIGKITPSYNSNRVSGFGTPIMRGVGTTNVTAGDEPSVATYVDGFYQGSGITAQIPFNNIDRVEVLKGPQGTLYGRNATGGLINIVTREPSDRLTVDASVGYDNYRTVVGNGYISGALSSAIKADLALAVREQGKGYARDIGTGGRVGKSEYVAVRSKIAFDLGGDNSLILGFGYVDSRDNRGNINIPYPGTTPLTTGPGIIYADRPFTYAGNLPPVFTVKQYNANATLRLSLGFADLVSMTQYKRVKSFNQLEGDGTTSDGIFSGSQLGVVAGSPVGTPLTPQTVSPFSFAYTVDARQPYFVTQELQLVSKADGPLKWIVGGFMQASKDGYHPINLYYDTADLNIPFYTSTVDETTRAYAGFVQATYSLDSGLSLTGGARYSSERKRLFGSMAIPIYAVDLTDDDAKTFRSFTWRAAVDYRVNPRLMIYATANKGFKSGVFDSNALGGDPVRPETLYAYEIGFKADPSPFVRLAASAYYYDYKDIQTFITPPSGLSVLQNAARGRMYGGEVSMEVMPAPGLNLTLSMGYEHARYKEFANAQINIPSPDGGNYFASADVGGRHILRTPDLTANGVVSYAFDAGGGKVNLNAAVAYSGDFFWDSANYFKQKEYALVDLSAKYTLPDSPVSISIWGKNITNQVYGIYRNPQQRFDAIAFGDPRTYGVTIGFQY